MSTENKRWAKLAGIPEQPKKQQLDENIGGVVSIGAINNLFDREKENYEDAFEHFLAERYGEKVEESNTTKLDKKIQSDPELLNKLTAATEKAKEGDLTDLALLMMKNLEEENLNEM